MPPHLGGSAGGSRCGVCGRGCGLLPGCGVWAGGGCVVGGRVVEGEVGAGSGEGAGVPVVGAVVVGGGAAAGGGPGGASSGSVCRVHRPDVRGADLSAALVVGAREVVASNREVRRDVGPGVGIAVAGVDAVGGGGGEQVVLHDGVQVRVRAEVVVEGECGAGAVVVAVVEGVVLEQHGCRDVPRP